MMDTCTDFYNSLSGSANSISSSPPSAVPSNSGSAPNCAKVIGHIRSSIINDHHDAAVNLGTSSSPAALTASTTAATVTEQPVASVHPLLQHNSHPQHLIAPVAPTQQLATVPPSAVVAPTITNHHPQQPLKFAGSGNGATGYSTTASGAQSSSSSSASVVNGTPTSNGHHQLQATVYPIQHHSHHQQHQKNSNSSLDSLKASVITENPFDSSSNPTAYHYNQVSGNYLQSVDGGNNLWSPAITTINGYGESSGEGVRSNNSNSFPTNLSTSCLLASANGSLDYSLNSFSENGLSQGLTTIGSNVGYSYSNHNYGGAGGGGGGIGTNGAGIGTAGGGGGGAGNQTSIEYQSTSSSKCTYNSSSPSASSSPVIITNQSATSPFQYAPVVNGQSSQQPNIPHPLQNQPQQHSFIPNNNAMLPNTMSSSSGRGNHLSSQHGHHFNGISGQMRSSNSFDMATNGTLEYQPQHYAPVVAPNGHSAAEGMVVQPQRTYMDLSSSKAAPANPVAGYYQQSQAQAHHASGQQLKATKRFSGGLYEDLSTQYLISDPNYAYNGYKTHPNAMLQMQGHVNQVSRSHYGRPTGGGGVGGGVVPHGGISHSQLDPKYRRTYAMYKNDSQLKATHMNYAHPHAAATQYASYHSTDPVTGKRIASYPPPSSHQPVGGYSEQIYADLDQMKKKTVYPPPPSHSKYSYPYMGPTSGQYGYGSNMHPAAGAPPPHPHGIHGTSSRATANYYPNGFGNYPSQPPQHQTSAIMNSYGGNAGGYHPPPPPPPQSAMNSQGVVGAPELYGHSNYLKSHPASSSHGMPKSALNRNCYYETNVPPAGEKTYVDLEDQIGGSKITKTRNGYVDYPPHYPLSHQAPYFDSIHPHHGQGGMGYNAKYCQETRYNMYQRHAAAYQQSQQPPHAISYYPGPVNPSSQSHLSHYPQQIHLMSGPVYGEATGKKINVREFLSSWNDEEDEVVGGVSGGVGFAENYQSANGPFQKVGLVSDPNLQRIQVGISIDKSNLMDSTGTMNLPDIIIDIEKQQKPVIPEIDLTGEEVNDEVASAAAPDERLYVLESIDVPLSDLNKYKHLNVINKLPENIVHLKEGEVSNLTTFNESELIHSEEMTDVEARGVIAAGDNAVENSLKFIEEIESSSDFKNDFELNVEYESFPVETSPEVASVAATSPVATELEEPSLAELVTRAEDLIAEQRKESVIVMKKKTKNKEKSEGAKKKKLKRSLKAQLKQLKANQEMKYDRETKKCSEVDSDTEEVLNGDFSPKGSFKTLVKCCLDVINTKQFRRNAQRYLKCESEVREESHVNLRNGQKESASLILPRNYKYLRRFHLEAPIPIITLFSPKTLREMCAEVVIAYDLVTIQEEFAGDDEEEEEEVDTSSTEHGNVPMLRDLCEEVLRQTNFIIDIDELSELEDNSKTTENPEDHLDDNNNSAEITHMALISGLTQEDMDQETGEPEMEINSFPMTTITQTEAEEMAAPPSAYLYSGEDAMMSCDYFLAAATGADDDQIQYSEEVVPVDPDRHKRKLLTDKYVHNKHNIHALASRRMILKKYFSYQKHLALVKTPKRNAMMTGRPESFVGALRKRYQKLMRDRQKWWKRSKMIVLEPVQPVGTKAVSGVGSCVNVAQRVQPIVIRPRAVIMAQSTSTEQATDVVHSNILSGGAHTERAGNGNDTTILKLIRDGMADIARNDTSAMETSEKLEVRKEIDMEVRMMRMEKATGKRPEVVTESNKNINNEREKYENREKNMKKRRFSPEILRRVQYKSRSFELKEKAGDKLREKSKELKKTRVKSERKEQLTKGKESEAHQVLSRKREDHNNDQSIQVQKDERDRTKEINRDCVVFERRRNYVENRPGKKVKPKFDDILLGIDNIYKSSHPVVAKVKPKKAFELVVDELSVSSPSSTSSSSSSSVSTTTSSGSSSSNKSVKSISPGSSSGRSRSGSSSDSSSTNRSRSGSFNAMPREKTKRPEREEEKRKIASKSQQSNHRRAEAKVCPPQGQFGPKKRRAETEMAAATVLKEKLIIKTAVVQLERDGYIDKLGKLYT